MKGPGCYDNDFYSIKSDIDLLKESIARILLTSPGERVNNPNFGSKLKTMLFDVDVYLMEDISQEIARSIQKWEPRVNIIETLVEKMDEYTISVKLTVQSKTDSEIFNVNANFAV